jgi:hypothetical protein
MPWSRSANVTFSIGARIGAGAGVCLGVWACLDRLSARFAYALGGVFLPGMESRKSFPSTAHLVMPPKILAISLPLRPSRQREVSLSVRSSVHALTFKCSPLMNWTTLSVSVIKFNQVASEQDLCGQRSILAARTICDSRYSVVKLNPPSKEMMGFTKLTFV